MDASYADRPTQSMIQRALERMPPLRREAAILDFVGLKVRWRTRYFDAGDVGLGSVKQVSFDQRGWKNNVPLLWSIYAQLDIEQFPQLLDLRRGTRVNLYGRIQRIEFALGTTLVLERFEILPINLLDRFVIREG